jgi:sporulation protein YlmC with PRC-barrel domain
MIIGTGIRGAFKRSVLVSAQPVSPANESAAPEPKPARQCMSDLHAADYGYGYPMFGVNYPYAGYVPVGGEVAASDFVHARRGYDVRTLIAAANILALRGQQAACEALLTATGGIYQDYLIDLRNAQIAKADVPAWRSHLIAGAIPVSVDTTSIKFDDLIGIDVVNSHNAGLRSVEDVLLNRKTGQIAYLVIGRDNAKADVYWKTRVSPCCRRRNHAWTDNSLKSVAFAEPMKRKCK